MVKPEELSEPSTLKLADEEKAPTKPQFNDFEHMIPPGLVEQQQHGQSFGVGVLTHPPQI